MWQQVGTIAIGKAGHVQLALTAEIKLPDCRAALAQINREIREGYELPDNESTGHPIGPDLDRGAQEALENSLRFDTQGRMRCIFLGEAERAAKSPLLGTIEALDSIVAPHLAPAAVLERTQKLSAVLADEIGAGETIVDALFGCVTGGFAGAAQFEGVLEQVLRHLQDGDTVEEALKHFPYDFSPGFAEGLGQAMQAPDSTRALVDFCRSFANPR